MRLNEVANEEKDGKKGKGDVNVMTSLDQPEQNKTRIITREENGFEVKIQSTDDDNSDEEGKSTKMIVDCDSDKDEFDDDDSDEKDGFNEIEFIIISQR